MIPTNAAAITTSIAAANRFMTAVHKRIIEKTGGPRIGVYAYLALNYLEDGQIFVRVATANDNGIRLYLKGDNFDWAALMQQVNEAVDRLIRDHRVWSLEDVGRTLGIVEPRKGGSPLESAAAAE